MGGLEVSYSVPLYEYQCAKCGRFEIIRKFSDQPLSVCPTCGQEIQKLLSAPAIQFKGTGWYVTDYARKGTSGGSSSSESGSASEKSGSSDGGKTSDSTSSPQTSTSKDSPASGSGSSK
jgi:putative FmdB family regulatory protein